MRKFRKDTIPSETRIEVSMRLGNRFCFYCGAALGPKRDACNLDSDSPTLDHVVPVSLGGDDSAANLVPACWDCNRRKGGRSLVKFAKSALKASRPYCANDC